MKWSLPSGLFGSNVGPAPSSSGGRLSVDLFEFSTSSKWGSPTATNYLGVWLAWGLDSGSIRSVSGSPSSKVSPLSLGVYLTDGRCAGTVTFLPLLLANATVSAGLDGFSMSRGTAAEVPFYLSSGATYTSSLKSIAAVAFNSVGLTWFKLIGMPKVGLPKVIFTPIVSPGFLAKT